MESLEFDVSVKTDDMANGAEKSISTLDKIGSAFESAKDRVESVVGSIRDKSSEIGQATATAANQVQKGAATIKTGFESIGKAIKNIDTGNLTKYQQKLLDDFERLGNKIEEKTELMNKFQETANRLADTPVGKEAAQEAENLRNEIVHLESSQQKVSDNFDHITSKIEQARSEAAEFRNNLDNVQRSMMEMDGAASPALQSIIDDFKNTETEIESVRNKLVEAQAEAEKFPHLASGQEAAAEIDTLNEKLDSLIDRQQELAEGFAQKQGFSDVVQGAGETRAGIDALSFSMRSMSRAIPGDLSLLTRMAFGLRYLKKAYSDTALAAGSTQAAMVAVTGGAMLGFTALMGIIGMFSKKAEETRQKAEELKKEVADMGKNIYGMNKLISEYQTLNASISAGAEDTERMKEIRAELVSQYGFSVAAVDAEGRQLAGNLGTMQEQLKIQKEIYANKLKQTAKDDFGDLSNTKGEIRKLETSRAALEGFTQETRDKLNELQNEVGLKGREIASALISSTVTQLQADGKQVPETIQSEIIDVITSKLKEGASFEEAESLLEEMINNSFTISPEFTEYVVEGVNSLFSEIKTAVEVGAMETEDSAANIQFGQKLLNSLIKDVDVTEAMRTMEEIGNLMLQGIASPEQQAQYDEAKQKVAEYKSGLVNLKNESTTTASQQKTLTSMIDKVDGAMNRVTADTNKNVKAQRQQKAEADKQKKVQEDSIKMLERIASGGEEAAKAYGDIYKQGENVAKLRGAFGIVEKATTKAQRSTKEYKAALDFLSENLGLDTSQIEGDLDYTKAIIGETENSFISLLNVIAQGSGVTFDPSAAIGSMYSAGNAADANAARVANFLNQLMAANGASLTVDSDDKGNMSVKSHVPKGGFSGGGRKSRGGGGGGGGSKSSKSKENTALQAAIAALEHKIALDKLSYEQELKQVAAIRKRYAKSSEEKRELLEREHNLRKQIFQSNLDYELTLGRISAEQQVKRLDRERKRYKAGTEQRREMDKQWAAAKMQAERAAHDHSVAMGRKTTQEQIVNLKRMSKQLQMSVEERKQITQEIFALEVQRSQETTSYQLALGKLTLEQEIKNIEALRNKYKKGTTEYMALDQEVYEKKKALERQKYDLAVHYGQLTLKQQVAQLEKWLKSAKKGTQEYINLQKELYDAQQQIRQSNISAIDNLLDGTVQALKNQYELQRQEEEERIKNSLDNWKDWADEQIKMINEQIKALDDMVKEEDRAEEERKRRRKIAALEQQLQYEQDEYNRRKLQEQIAQEQKSLADWLHKNEIADQKEALKEQIEALNEQKKAEEDKANDLLNASKEYYNELLNEQRLQAEAQQMIMSGSQDKIIALLKQYYPEYNATGKTMGEKLVDGFLKEVKDIEKWFDGLNTKIGKYQTELSNAAMQSVNNYQANQQEHEDLILKLINEHNANIAANQMPSEVTIIIQQEVKNPTEVKWAVKDALEEISKGV